MSASGTNAGWNVCGRKGVAIIVAKLTSSSADMSCVVMRLRGANASHAAMTHSNGWHHSAE